MTTHRRLGRYQLTRRIAFGGMAELYRAFTFDADGFKREVAIKRLLPQFAEDPQFVEMLADEFRIVSHLRHPNIAEVYELVEVGSSLLIAMEYVDGKDLRSTLEKARAAGVILDLDDVAYVMARTMEGLHHAHVARDGDDRALGVVHRDVSPSNLILTFDGNVKLCDFGIAKATHNRVETDAGVIKGKAKYMSPEQALGRKLDWRSDIFSAGSVLYELATGVAPFQASNEFDLIFAVRDARPIPARELNPAVPERLAAIIERSMMRSRSARYPSGLEMRDELIRFIREYNPRYKRTKLSRLMKALWGKEIERDLREMEELVLDAEETAPGDLGRNLIADALGRDAPYAGFRPDPAPTVARDVVAEKGAHGGTGTERIASALESTQAASGGSSVTRTGRASP
jgi:serine/threonine-protein kinase